MATDEFNQGSMLPGLNQKQGQCIDILWSELFEVFFDIVDELFCYLAQSFFGVTELLKKVLDFQLHINRQKIPPRFKMKGNKKGLQIEALLFCNKNE
ncbi:hypothetical protein D3C87_1721870 [compost metagenome]